MRIGFFGTPDFVIPSLKILIESGYELSLVVTVPDKEQGRGLKPNFSPVKKFALEKGLKIAQPGNLNDEDFVRQLRELNLDVGVVVAFRILPRSVYTIPKFGTFNLHASLLPKYRGAAPIQWALINGEKKTGLTTFFLEDKVDTGNIILQREIEIDDEDNFETLHDKMSVLGAEVVLKTIKMIERGEVRTIKQDDTKATPAPKITKEIAKINWQNEASRIHNLIRGLSPVPCAWTTLEGKIVKIFKSKVSNEFAQSEPGEFEIIEDKFLVNTFDKKLEVLELQVEGRKRMNVVEFLRGFRIDPKKQLRFT